MKVIKTAVEPIIITTITDCRPEDKTYYAYASQSSNDIHFMIRNIYYAGGKIDGINVQRDKGAYFVVWDGAFALKNEAFHKAMQIFRKSESEFTWSDVAKRMVRKSFFITTQLSVLMELGIKKSLCYIHEDEICKPSGISEKDVLDYPKLLLPMAIAADVILTKSISEWEELFKEAKLGYLSDDACSLINTIHKHI